MMPATARITVIVILNVFMMDNNFKYSDMPMTHMSPYIRYACSVELMEPPPLLPWLPPSFGIHTAIAAPKTMQPKKL